MEVKEFYLFNELNNDELQLLEKISQKKHFYQDNILFYKGDKSSNLYLLLNGIARIYKHNERGNEVSIHTITAPSFIAEVANFNNRSYPANCSFETDSEILIIDYEKFEKEFLYKPQIAMQFIRSLSNKIKYLESFISNNINKNSLSKVAKFLYEYEKDLDTLKNVQIAKILGITPETLSRKITTLKKEGIIDKVNRTIKIIDKEKLILFIEE